jgi:hypothetical protein
MADGKGSRWNNFMGHKKHEISVGGETLLERTVRLVRENDSDADVIITSHDESINISGARRYEPKNNILEIDRFTAELIGDDMCFLYGDVLYSKDAIRTIISHRSAQPLLFFGSDKSICAVLIENGELFRSLYLEVRQRFTDGEIAECKGWQVYHLYAGLSLEGRETGKSYVLLDSFTRDFNSPEDYLGFISAGGNVQKNM